MHVVDKIKKSLKFNWVSVVNGHPVYLASYAPVLNTCLQLLAADPHPRLRPNRLTIGQTTINMFVCPAPTNNHRQEKERTLELSHNGFTWISALRNLPGPALHLVLNSDRYQQRPQRGR